MYDPSEALLQLGLYDYVWGNPALLQTYNANVQADKARKEQQDYNTLWKNIELAKMQKEQDERKAKEEKEEAARKADEKRQRDAEKATLYKQYNEAKGAAERAAIQKQIDVLEGRDDTKSDYVRNEMLAAYDQDKADKEAADIAERDRKHNALDTLAKIDAAKRKATTAKQKEDLAKEIATDEEKYPHLTQEERDKIVADIRGIKTLDEMMQDAAQNAAVQNAGNLTANRLAWQNVLRRSKEPGYTPSTEDKAVAKKNNFYWDKKIQDYVKIGGTK